MRQPRFHCCLALAGWLASAAAHADVVLSGGASYSSTPTYTTSGSSVTSSTSGGGLQFVSTIVSSGTNAYAVVGALNQSFTYNPSTQGAIQSITASVSKDLTINLAGGPGYSFGNIFLPMIEQDGNYYLATIPAPNFSGGSTGFLSLSQSGLVASNFVQFDFATGAFLSGNPNFSGDPMMFGLTSFSNNTINITYTAVYQNLTFDIANAPAGPLTVTPGIVNFAGEANSSGSLQQGIVVQNAGSGNVSFTASLVSGSSWASVSPSSGTAAAGSAVPIRVTVSPQTLNAGNYRDVIHFSSPAGVADVPVTLFTTNSGAILGAGPVGAVFNIVQGSGSGATETINISNDGSQASTVNWTASAATGSGLPNGNFLTFGNPGGQVQPGNLGKLTLSLNGNASKLAAGVYYELVQITGPGAQNSPQYVTAILNVLPGSATALPKITPAGLLFTGAVGQSIASQQFTVNWSSTAYQLIQAAATVPAGQSWLQAVTTSTAANSSNPAVLTVAVNTTGLAAGVYTGTIDLTTVGTVPIGSVNVTLVVATVYTGMSQPDEQTGPRAKVHSQAVSGCAPSALVLTETGIPNNFSVPAGWPANLIATMIDDCGNPVEGGAVAASFSNGDPPLSLDDQGSGGLYVATWQPSNRSNSNMTVLLNGTAGTLKPALARLGGFVSPNQAPVLNSNGIVNGFTFLSGGALAPGMVASAFGSGLTTSPNPVSPGTTPLPTQFQNTQLVVGGFVAPLYFLSNSQLNVQIPAELAALQQVPAVGVVNNALTLPVQITVVPTAPGVAASTDGSVIAQDSNFNLITSGSPAHPGESIVIYLVGMGATNPAVSSNSAAPGLNPGDTLAKATVQPVVKVNNQTAQIQFAGLTPGAIGLYQINFVVPTNVPAGSLSLTVSQGIVNANSTTLPVVVP
jgi:uncharacterized protein (TIGR03437 family)